MFIVNFVTGSNGYYQNMLPKFSSQFGDVTGGLLSMSPISFLTSRSIKMKEKKKEKNTTQN